MMISDTDVILVYIFYCVILWFNQTLIKYSLIHIISMQLYFAAK